MDMLKIEQVIVGGERRSTSAEMKSEPVVTPLQSYQHESLQCFQCFITFCDSKAKERHMRKSHRDQYKQQLQQLNQHRRHECIERRCPCRDCGALFPSPSRLRSHRMAVHPQSPVVADDINTYQCCKCGSGFQTEDELLQHQEKFANDLNCNIKPQSKKRGRKPKCAAQGIVHSKKIKQEEEVEGCEGRYNSTAEGCPSDEVQQPLKIPCPEADCDLIFPSVAALRAHKKDQHGTLSGKSHACTECKESFARPEQLKRHMTKAHRSSHTCSTCSKSFARESALKVHKNTHTEGEEVAEKR
ncbi:zinc finger protein 16-like isoform X2 [Channa argus]|uniref:zinc finger protein 16-like isoform X2 n=1 Tax=Channa argus TaxID=215402 RepID=UPI00351F8B1D